MLLAGAVLPMSTGDYFCVCSHRPMLTNPGLDTEILSFSSPQHFSPWSLCLNSKNFILAKMRDTGSISNGHKATCPFSALSIHNFQAGNHVTCTLTQRHCPWSASALRYLKMGISLHNRAHCVLASTMKKGALYLSWKKCECVHGTTAHKYILELQVFLDTQGKKKTTTKIPCFNFPWILTVLHLLFSLAIVMHKNLYFFAIKSCQIIIRMHYSM